MAVGEKAWLRRPAVRAGVVSVLAMGYAVLVWLATLWWGTWILGVGLVVFGAAVYWRPETWLRRMASASLYAACATGMVPSVVSRVTGSGRVTAEAAGAGEVSGFAELVIDGAPWVTVAFVLAAVVFAWLDTWKEMRLEQGESTPTVPVPVQHVEAKNEAGQQVVVTGGGMHVKGNLVFGSQGDQGTGREAIQLAAKMLDAREDDKARYREDLDKLKRRLDEKDGSIRELEAALARVGASAAAGNEEARTAIVSAREDGDASELQSVLIGYADEIGERTKKDLEEYVELCREIAAIAYLRGDIDEAERRLESILRLREDDAGAINSLAHVWMLRGQLDKAKAGYERILSLVKREEEWVAIACGNLGLIARTRGDLDEAERLHRKSLEIDEKLGRLKGKARQYGNLGVIAQIRGGLDEAERLHRKALEIEEQLGRLEGVATNYGNLGLIARTRGDLDEAERLHRKSLEIDEKLGWLEGKATQYASLGLVRKRRGDFNEAERLHRKALKIEDKLGRLEGIARQYGNLGAVAKLRGRVDEARTHWEESIKLYKQIGLEHMVEKVQGWLDGLEDD